MSSGPIELADAAGQIRFKGQATPPPGQPLGPAGGDLAGDYPNPVLDAGVAALNVGNLHGALSGTLPNPKLALPRLGVNVGSAAIPHNASQQIIASLALTEGIWLARVHLAGLAFDATGVAGGFAWRVTANGAPVQEQVSDAWKVPQGKVSPTFIGLIVMTGNGTLRFTVDGNTDTVGYDGADLWAVQLTP